MKSKKIHISNASNTMRQWSELPNDILGLVLKRLPLVFDHIQFGCVCSSWHQAMLGNRRWMLSRRQLPFLMLPDQERSQIRQFFSLSENKLSNIRLPLFNGKWCRGSSKGWLITIDERSKVHLLNPFSKIQIELPSLDKFPHPQYRTNPDMPSDYEYMYKAVLSANPHSTPNYIVATIVTNMSRMSFYKPGDETWTTLETPWEPFQDVIYYKDKFYAIGHRGAVVMCDFASTDFPKFTVVTPEPPSWERNDKIYLVESAGELLKVIRFYDWNPELDRYYGVDYEGQDEDGRLLLRVYRMENNPPPDWFYRTVMFYVFQLDQNTRKWIKVQSLDDRMLFLGYNCSFSLSANDFPQCKGNCIYFTDDNEDATRCVDNGVFNLEDGSVRPCYPNSTSWIAKPIWIEPTLW
ncbi:F-box protein SKIP23-like [Tasmannia lanceolata]|uniref:F-box protein SKIP23-like n=1 Tax=Tasmannia lanceolata TaxID=3420 RepID=UPI004062CFEC